MRRREAATSCLGCSVALWRVPLFLVAFLLLRSSAVHGSGYALTVTTAEALHEAFLNRNVSIIYLGQDIILSKSVWHNGLGNSTEPGIVVERNLTLTTHPSLREYAVLYLDYMQNRVLAGTDVFLRIDGVVMTGVSRHPLNLFFVPFFQFLDGGTIFMENSQFQMAIDPGSLWPLGAYPSKMNATARPPGYEHWPVEADVVSTEACEGAALRETNCEDGAIYVESLSARLTVFDEQKEPIGKAAFLAENVLMVAEAFEVGELVEHKIANVSNALEFKKALQNPLVTDIHVTSRSINLTADIFSPASRTPITRNLTITTSRELETLAVIDFNYLQSAIVAGVDVEIRLTHLNFTRVSEDPLDFELVPFFSLQPGARYLYRNIVSEMSLSPGAVYPLNQLPVVLYGGDLPEGYDMVNNSVDAVSSKWCEADGRTACPDGALYIRRGVRRWQVLDVYNQDMIVDGIVDIENMLIRTIDVTKKDLNAVAAPDESSESGKRKTISAKDTAGSENRTGEEEERKSFGFVGGFDPWILIYALVAAAMLLGICLFITIHRRRRDQKEYKQNPSVHPPLLLGPARQLSDACR